MSATSSASPHASTDTTVTLVAHENRGIQGPVWVAWREGTLTRAEELEALCEWEMAKAKAEKRTPNNYQVLADAIHRHLKAAVNIRSSRGAVGRLHSSATEYESRSHRFTEYLQAARQAATKETLRPNRRLVLIRRIFRNGPLIERAQSNLDAAEAQLLNLVPASYILGQMPCLLRHVQCHLPSTDPARQEFERIARKLGINDPDRSLPQNSNDEKSKDRKNTVEAERGQIVTAVRAASSAALRERVRLRNFRNVVVATTVLMALLAIGVAVTGFLRPTLIPLCFAPEASGQAMVVCPTAQSPSFSTTPAKNTQPGTQVEDIDDFTKKTVSHEDLLVVELVGLTAAAVARPRRSAASKVRQSGIACLLR